MIAPDRPGPAVAVTLGDPRGIGPEVMAAAAARVADGDDAPPLVWIVSGDRTDDPDLPGSRRTVPAWDGSDRDAGRVAGEALELAVALALDGTVGAIVTGPLHKPSLHAAGWRTPGQTELLGERSGASRVGMLMCAERTRLGAPLRVLLATTHLALRDVPDTLDAGRLAGQARLLHEALVRDWRIPDPRIALCAFNPHAGDDGLFGDEESRVYAPALAELAAAGVEATGPVPADTVFSRALAGEFDAVVAPYHDVGMAAFKTVSFGTGVNVTLGLPFVRTSPDHGTAFDIAGTGRADASSAEEALRLAARLARGRFDTAPHPA